MIAINAGVKGKVIFLGLTMSLCVLVHPPNLVRSLVDILRHQSSPVQQGERNNTSLLTTATSDGRMSKTLYTPILQSKDNRSKKKKIIPRTQKSGDSRQRVISDAQLIFICIGNTSHIDYRLQKQF